MKQLSGISIIKINKKTIISKSNFLIIFLLLPLIIFLWFFLTAMFPLSSDEGSVSDQTHMDISVSEMAGLTGKRMVSGGVPIPEGSAPEGSRFRLLDSNNKAVPCQWEVLAQWKDGSARWVLLDFQAGPRAGQTDNFRLVWDSRYKDVQPSVPVKVSRGSKLLVSSGKAELKTVAGALLRVSDRYDIRLVMKNKQGIRCEAIAESMEIETAGKMRSTLILKGSFRDPQGLRIVDFRLRASVFAGLTQIFLEPQIIVNADNDMITSLQDLSLEFVSLKGLKNVFIGGQPGFKGIMANGQSVRLLQIDDGQYRLEGAEGKGTKAPGWMEAEDPMGKVAFTLRDFWQQWPKSLEAGNNVLKLGLFPYFKAGAFSHMGPWYKYDYLFEGNCYRLREGQSRRWQIWMDISGSGEELSRSISNPLIAAADPQQAIATGEWGFIAPAGSKGMQEYDTWAENLFEGYCNSIREQRDYGAMNWGDWWGERGVNWGNHEYDTPLHILIQFARTGDPKYFYVGAESARHFAEVDVVHSLNDELRKYFSRWESKAYPSRPGMVHEHSIGHVGGFHPVEKIKELYVNLNIGDTPNPYLCLDPFNLGHIFTLGMAQYYLLTGDLWVKETLDRIGDNLMRLTEDGLFKFKNSSHCGRVNGWTMLALAGVYKVEPSERCLKAMKKIADDALEEQNPNCGGWLYSLPWGHCNCVPVTERNKGLLSHVGEATFISSIRLNGLSYYYRLTGDERIPLSISLGVAHFNNDTWNEQKGGWRYTSCPATINSIGQGGTIIMSVVNNLQINKDLDPEQMRIFRKAWENKFSRLLQVPKSAPGLGKSYSTNMYGSPEAINLYINGNK